jgi:hypothetical protein
MRRISLSFDKEFLSRVRRNFAATAFAFCAAAGVLWSSAQAVRADNVAGGVENPALKIDIGCAQRDLELFTMIERNGNGGLSTTATLVETSDLLETAREACAIGDVENALALYDTAIRRLENPSDFARR